MPDAYATIAQQPRDVVETLAHALETRAASPQQRTMLEAYLAHLDFPDHARVLEIGCGTGPVAAVLAQWPRVAEVVGIDPSPGLLEKARALRGAIRNLSFQEGDGRSLAFENATFDTVVMHTLLSHIPSPDRVVAEAYRVLRPGGWLAIFDGDYATITVTKHPYDPLAMCIESFKANFINDVWLMRRLPALVTSLGFGVVRFASHGYTETADPGYMLTIVDRGADALSTAGIIGQELAAACKAEARRRAERGEFFGHIAYASLLARKPA
jgi:ubiquinone/menaquinone biosynthesis C-methylase UbiE